MRRWYFVLSSIFVITVCARPVFAHTLKVDGFIGVTTHIDPDDEPIAGQESKLFVSIEDRSNRFNPNSPGNCACTLAIERDGKIITTLPVVNGGMFTQLRYTFPAAGSYDLIIEGKPNGTGGIFQAFSTRFSYYVRGGGLHPDTSSEHNVLLTYFPYLVVFVGSSILISFIEPWKPAGRKGKKKN